MTRLSRRRFLELLGQAGTLSALSLVLPPLARAADKPGAKASARVVIVGGGFGGA
jgi:hypothetical protein